MDKQSNTREQLKEESTTWFCQVIVHCEIVSVGDQESGCGTLSDKASRNQSKSDLNSSILQYRQVVSSQDEFVIESIVIHIFSRRFLLCDRTSGRNGQTEEQPKSQEDMDLGSGRAKRYKRAAKPQACSASTETRLVLDAINGALNDLKEQTSGAFGINQPFACSVLDCTESDLQGQLHNKLCSAAGAQLYRKAEGAELPSRELPDLSLHSPVNPAVDMNPGEAEDKVAEDLMQEGVVSSQNEEPPCAVMNYLDAASELLAVMPSNGLSMSMDKAPSIPPAVVPKVAWQLLMSTAAKSESHPPRQLLMSTAAKSESHPPRQLLMSTAAKSESQPPRQLLMSTAAKS
eukprot:gene31623-6817_t